ncbi:LamG domain-containing protein, partial [Seonamhaeicola marinus]|uniref:beta-agarase n=1 Tax=Seonamhaeicola marinus TaxID=1912246 RepID=UPI001FE748E3
EEEEEEEEEEETNQSFTDIEVPANAGDGLIWEFQEDLSDDFEYEYAGEPNLATFGNGKWTNFYHNTWNGPGPTIWRHENVTASGGNLRLLTTRVDGETKTYGASNGNRTDKATRLGCITSTKRVKYPVFVEARVLVANAFFASDIWMLSPDDTQEIDILEAYGAQNPRNEQSWFSERFHISHHVFIRNPFQDYQPKDASTWQKVDGYPYTSSDWVRIGVYWKSPTHLEYYINGNLIKVMDNLDTVGDKHGIDPLNYTSPTGNAADRTGLSKEMDIIINAEVQNWNAEQGRMPTDEEIANNQEDHTLKVDWIRVFKPVSQ